MGCWTQKQQQWTHTMFVPPFGFPRLSCVFGYDHKLWIALEHLRELLARVQVIFVTVSVRKSEINLQVDKKIYHHQHLVKVTLLSDTKPLIVYGRSTCVTLVMCSHHTDSHLQPTNETHTPQILNYPPNIYYEWVSLFLLILPEFDFGMLSAVLCLEAVSEAADVVQTEPHGEAER